MTSMWLKFLDRDDSEEIREMEKSEFCPKRPKG